MTTACLRLHKIFCRACGSGNFLTETYISLRRLENEAISLLHRGQIMLDIGNPIQVSIGQLYTIGYYKCFEGDKVA